MLFAAPNNVGLDPFSDPVSHFRAPWQPFWIHQTIWITTFLIEWLFVSKNLFRKSCLEHPKTYNKPLSRSCRLFWSPWQPFLTYRFSNHDVSHRTAPRIKKVIRGHEYWRYSRTLLRGSTGTALVDRYFGTSLGVAVGWVRRSIDNDVSWRLFSP